MKKNSKIIILIACAALIIFGAPLPLFAETAGPALSLSPNHPFENTVNVPFDSAVFSADRHVSYVLMRNQFGDVWRVVVNNRHVTLVNDHEQLDGSVRRYRFFKNGKTSGVINQPLSAVIDPAQTEVSIVTGENAQTIRFTSKTGEVIIRAERFGNHMHLTMANRRAGHHGQETALSRKAIFDYQPFLGRGTLTVGSIEAGADGENRFRIAHYHVLNLADGYFLKRAGNQFVTHQQPLVSEFGDGIFSQYFSRQTFLRSA